MVTAAGGEIGLHGIHHDGMLFRSRSTFEANVREMARYFAEWGAVGFRSPATHRNAEWMNELRCLYDSSFPDTDPFEPQPGGCCSILPFFFGDVVELPITLLMDHTMFEILRRPGIEVWTDKAAWLIGQRGLVNLITHPDYLAKDDHLERYDAFLAWLVGQPCGWLALPREVAEWWTVRSRLDCDFDEYGEPVVTGLGAEDAGIVWARLSGEDVVFEPVA
jgi:hypothetical protein